MKILSTEKFLQKCRTAHGNTYDYSITKYLGDKAKVSIICKEHGIFQQLPGNHMRGKGCRKCGNKKISNARVMTQNEFIIRANQKYNFKYDYSLVNYKSSIIKVNIICPQHGTFEAIPYTHIKGHECKKCGFAKQGISTRNDQNAVIDRCKVVHSDRYDYSAVNYANCDSKIEIICKIHGSFFQTLNNHLFKAQGCPECNQYSKSERYISKLLKYNKIDFEPQKTFHDFKNKKSGRYYRFDFYIKTLNTIVEYDGAQHFHHVSIWSDHCLTRTQNRDKLKNEYCNTNGIKLIRISYKENITRKLLDAKIIHLTIPNHPSL